MLNEDILINDCWDKDKYNSFIELLKSLQDIKYKNFNESLVLNSKYDMIGIKIPVMRDIAKTISKGNIISFLENSENNYYEEIMIQGLTISYIKDENVFNKYFNKHVKKIDNWALCDSFCSSIKIIRNFEEKYFELASKMALNEEEFISRVGIVIVLNYFVNEKNIETIFNILNEIKSDKFYINMAEAWLICEMYTKFKDKTLEFLKNNNLNSFTQNKAISKIRDSYRVSKEEKEYLKNYKK